MVVLREEESMGTGGVERRGEYGDGWCREERRGEESMGKGGVERRGGEERRGEYGDGWCGAKRLGSGGVERRSWAAVGLII